MTVTPAMDSTDPTTLRPPGPVAERVDAELFALDWEIDWLIRVSPLDNEARWQDFSASGFSECPPLTYPPLGLDTGALRARLDAVPVDDVEQPTLAVLLAEKRDELGQFLMLLDAREQRAFTTVSQSLFGGNDPSLLADALTILDEVPEDRPTGAMADADDLVAQAEHVRRAYVERAPDFHFEIEVVDDADAALMVHHGDLLISRYVQIPPTRVPALVAHEVGVHVLTRYNGRRQSLRLFESGFAGYDSLQEGLATFCEYLGGCLPATRLRTLAARVVAADLAIRHEPIETIFHELHGRHGLAERAAFDVAVRARRGGGLTKDAVYLEGLRELHAWLGEGGDIAQLFLGKYALRQRHLMAELVDDGFLEPAALLPLCLTEAGGVERLAEAIDTPFTRLYQEEDPP